MTYSDTNSNSNEETDMKEVHKLGSKDRYKKLMTHYTAVFFKKVNFRHL